ncbi:phosphatidylglycerophosphatase A family protein [Desulfoferrobacter suflitae]|uniref:phosphatidylglycerophosphatase A family protein n=1 Tax=Desulfoferrobacter suflitae TaxID=2865782 RepID=UPI002164D3E1|nr:phosphatidylglycerophosphatase A [Desulfoferrobacter suflitae]MCK8601448.1 phosphatidylglycerophosphatase A [Desulfoferrobacter suflitae]
MSRVRVSIWLAELGGIGKSPFAPGTVASVLTGIPAAYCLSFIPRAWLAAVMLCLFVVACYASEIAERHAGRVDPGAIVIDELFGYLVTVIGFPLGWKPILLGLILFRLFDILKPWPIGLLNKEIPGGIWIVLDDAAAGGCARLVLWMTLMIWP